MFTELAAGRALADRFVAGETLDDAMRVAKDLNGQGMSVSLDYLGEHVESHESAERAAVDYLACLDRIGWEGLDANISIKLTQLGLAFDEELCRMHVDRLAERAGELGITVTIDMEEGQYTRGTLAVYAEAQAKHGNLGVALQAYLHRTSGDLTELMPLGGHLRLCKGAYAESGHIAYQSRGAVNSNFAELLDRLMHGEAAKPAIATHDDSLIERTLGLIPVREGPFEFQMLFGVRTDRQAELVADGHPLRVYVPYGSEWYPYLTRRLAERPANLVFFARAVLGR